MQTFCGATLFDSSTLPASGAAETQVHGVAGVIHIMVLKTRRVRSSPHDQRCPELHGWALRTDTGMVSHNYSKSSSDALELRL